LKLTTANQVFARNPEERNALSEKHIAFAGCGSIGGGVAEIATRTGVGRVTLIDPDVVSPENIGRHVLTTRDIGKPKVEALASHLAAINPELAITRVCGPFSGDLAETPDLLISAVDSFQCESLINIYSLGAKVPAIYSGVWGAASVGELYYVIPGKTPCYHCFASFRQDAASELPTDPRKYTDPDFDDTRVPGRPGLWAQILVVSGLCFQLGLGLLGLRPQLIDELHTLWLFNMTDFNSSLQPLAVTFGKTAQRGCAVCDPSRLGDLEAGVRGCGVGDERNSETREVEHWHSDSCS
jgi:molybdopterin/thiamine biosynthesis adenylyltransferase